MLCDADCVKTPVFCRPNVPAPLWHSRHSVKTTGLRSSFALVDPCGMWQAIAAFHAHAGVFVDEGPALIHVALQAGLLVIERRRDQRRAGAGAATTA